MKLSYKDLMNLYDAIRKEIRRRNDAIPTNIKEIPYGTD